MVHSVVWKVGGELCGFVGEGISFVVLRGRGELFGFDGKGRALWFWWGGVSSVVLMERGGLWGFDGEGGVLWFWQGLAGRCVFGGEGVRPVVWVGGW